MALAPAPPQLDLDVLDRVQDRVLWLATAIVHHANRVRPNRSMCSTISPSRKRKRARTSLTTGRPVCANV